MGILGMIGQAKAKFKAAQSHKREVAYNRLEKENIELEKQYKVEKRQYDTKEKHRELVHDRREIKIAPIRRFAKGLQKTMRASKERGAGRDVFGGSGGRNVFGGGNSGGSDIFGGSQPKKQKKKGKRIIIEI